MVKIDIISGFLGAGKTTLIKKLLKDGFQGEQVVLIENEFGEIGIDGGFLKEAGIQIREMNSGCICCSLVGDFGTSLKEVVTKYDPDRILIEPSGKNTALNANDTTRYISTPTLSKKIILFIISRYRTVTITPVIYAHFLFFPSFTPRHFIR